MPTDQNNTRYPFPFESGDDGWGDDMSSTMDQLAVEVPKSGLIADRPSAGAEFAPDFYYAEDKQIQYFNEGSTWRALDSRARLLSTFNTLQEAVDWSKANGSPAATVIVDGEFTTSEGTVTLPNRAIFRGMGNMNSRIITTSSTTNPLFEYQDGLNTIFNLYDVGFINNGAGARPFFKCAVAPSSFSGFLGTQFRWENVYIQDFGGVYPVDFANMWGGSVDNVFATLENGSPTGGMRLHNCNACHFDNLRIMYCISQDLETPVLYAYNCVATHIDSPHIEHLDTDAAVQITNGNVVLTSLHLEGNPGTYPSAYNAAIQLGDGGITTGNTEGSTDQGTVTIVGGVVHGSQNPMEAVRVLNADSPTLMGFGGSNGQNSFDFVNFGGSNHDTGLTTNPGTLTIFGQNSSTSSIINNDGAAPNIFIAPAKIFDSETDAQNTLNPYEFGFMDNSTGGHSLVRRDDAGTIHVWDPERTI